MNSELLVLNNKQTDTLNEQTRGRLQETLELELNKQRESFSFNPPKKLVEEGKLLSAVASFEATHSVQNINRENNSFSTTTPGFWTSRGGTEKFIKLRELLELRTQKDIKLHVEEVKKRGNKKKIRDFEYNISDLGTCKKDVIEDLKLVEYNDLGSMVFRLRLTCTENLKKTDMKYIDAST